MGKFLRGSFERRKATEELRMKRSEERIRRAAILLYIHLGMKGSFIEDYYFNKYNNTKL